MDHVCRVMIEFDDDVCQLSVMRVWLQRTSRSTKVYASYFISTSFALFKFIRPTLWPHIYLTLLPHVRFLRMPSNSQLPKFSSWAIEALVKLPTHILNQIQRDGITTKQEADEAVDREMWDENFGNEKAASSASCSVMSLSRYVQFRVPTLSLSPSCS